MKRTRADVDTLTEAEKLALMRELAQESPEIIKIVAREQGILGGRRKSGKSLALRTLEKQLRTARARVKVLEAVLTEHGGDPSSPDSQPNEEQIAQARAHREQLAVRIGEARKSRRATV